MAHAMRHRLPALVILTGLATIVMALGCHQTTQTSAPAPPPDYLFCFWNVENLFDDQIDHLTNRADQDYDRWFAEDPSALRLKLSHLSEELIALNGGKGPDILAVAEVECARAADLLRQALNDRLGDKSWHYEHVLMKEPTGGRHIAPAIITRLPVKADRTRAHGRRLRILEGHIVVDGHDLVVIASHWTSRISDKEGAGRAKYGDQIYGVYKGMIRSNPNVDFLVCGDFNDPPDAPSVVDHLHAVGDSERVREARDEPLLLDLFANRDPKESGTHYHAGRWYIFDQIAVSPGMLDDQGWRCDPASARTVNETYRKADRKRRPWPFGNRHERGPRGYSDHFPVTIRLSVSR